jgi:hypothetical protein
MGEGVKNPLNTFFQPNALSQPSPKGRRPMGARTGPRLSLFLNGSNLTTTTGDGISLRMTHSKVKAKRRVTCSKRVTVLSLPKNYRFDKEKV